MESASSIRVVPAAGQTVPGVGKYRYIAMLAEGGMADVFLAVTQNSGFEKLVVIKQLRDSLAQDPSFVAMFMDEARLAARLNHPNVVQTLEVGTDQATGLHFIAMEFLEGVAHVRFARMKERVPPPLAFHIRIIIDTLRGLHYAHDLRDFDGKPLNVVHRDVSPQNVMLTFAGGVKVLDFGIAKAALAAEKRPEDFKGKLEYMAPEQALLEDVDRRADIFSVGVMLYEALTRRRLYRKGEDKLKMLIEGRLPKASDIVSSTPRRLGEICAKAMAHHRDDRYKTADAMADDLEDWLGSTTQHVAGRDVGSYIAEKFSSTRQKISAAIEAQLALIRSMPESAPDTIPLSRLPSGSNDLPPPADLSLPPVDYTIPPGVMHSGMGPLDTGPLPIIPLTGPIPPAMVNGGQSSSYPAIPGPPGMPTGTSASSSSVWATADGSTPPHARSHSTTGSGHNSAGGKSGIAIVGAVLVGIVVLGGIVALASNARSKRAAAVAAASASASASAVAVAPGGASPSVIAPEEAQIEFTIKASPHEAKIFLDGKQLASNPASGKRPRDGAMHLVRIEAPGHDAREESFAFDRSLLINIELRPAQATWEAPSSTGTAASRSRNTNNNRWTGPQRNNTSPGTRGGSTHALDPENPYK